MKKRILYLLLTAAMLLAAVLPMDAAGSPLVYDEADLLTEAEETALTAKLEEIGKAGQMDIVVAAFNTTGGYSAMEYADDFYDYNGYGYGDSHDGLILVLVMDTRDWWISTCGRAISVFTDAGIDYIGEQIVPYLSAADYAGGFSEFADQCEAFIAKADAGDPYDYHNLPKAPFEAGAALVIAVVLGLIIGAIYAGTLKAQLKTVRPQRAASSYLKKDSLQITDSKDLYLYRHVSRVARETSSSRGGSSTHTSSSGRSHGGGGGRF